MNLVQAIKSYFAKLKERANPTDTFAIGTQLAEATASQQRQEELHGSQVSPLIDLSYSSTESRLWRWADSPVDGAIEAIVTTFAGLETAQRQAMRDSLSMDDFYTLMTFAQRCALASLRSGNVCKIESAYSALTMIALDRIDWRDLSVTNWLVSYAAEKAGMSTASLLNEVAQIAESQTAKALRRDWKGSIDLAEMCGLREVSTPAGVALFQTDYQPYSPEADLAAVAFDCAVALEQNGYEIDRVKIASDLPLTWLDSNEGSAIAKVVEKLSGCVTISGVPRADPAPMSSGQSLLVFLAEAACKKDAREIASKAEDSSSSSSTQLGWASGKLCAVIIQHSWIADTPPSEDKSSLERLRAVFDRIQVGNSQPNPP